MTDEGASAGSAAHAGAGAPGRALVFGASGYLGSHLVPRLLAAGLPVRATSRNTAALEGRGWGGAELVRADALDPGTLDAVLAGVETAYYLVHSMGHGKDFERIDAEAAGHFAAAAARAGVRRIVYVGGLQPGDAASTHLRSRAETGEILRSSGVPVIELRAGIIVGPGSAAFEIIRDLVNNLPAMVTPRWVRSRTPPIALDDLLAYLEALPGIPEAEGRILDAAGPEMLSYEDLMRIFGDVVGRPRPIVPVPVLTPRLSSYWLGLVTAVPTPVARALIEGLATDIPAEPGALHRLVPRKLMSFRAAVEAALAAERRNAVATRWVEGALMFRGYRQDHAFYAKKASGSASAPATPETMWRVVRGIGGKRRYFYVNLLWTLRETMDWLVGGPGLSRGRRHPDDLRVGDYVDSWQVVAMEPGRRLTLGFGMKAPGSGVLEFEISPEGETTRVTVTAYWHPAGLWGLAYWYLFAPAHGFLFRGMSRAIAREAEIRTAEAAGVG